MRVIQVKLAGVVAVIVGALIIFHFYIGFTKSEKKELEQVQMDLPKTESHKTESGLSVGSIKGISKTLNQKVVSKSLKVKQSPESNDLLLVAKKISQHHKTVLVTMINDAYLPFTYSWLCNTKTFGIHRSVLIITTDEKTKQNLTTAWPEIHVVSLQMEGSHGDQVYSRVGYVNIMVRRTEMILTLVEAGLDVFLFEVDCLWLSNPTSEFVNTTGYDMLVNPVAERKDVYAGGFLYMYATDKARSLWKELTRQMVQLGNKIKNLPPNQKISEAENDQIYISNLIVKRFGGVKVKELPLQDYQDGKWYSFSEDKRKALHPIVINNNWVEGNPGKIARAKKWGHWFLRADWSCDMEQVKKVIYPI